MHEAAPTARVFGRERGVTLLELIVVMGILSVLLGIGVGFLQSSATDVDVAMMTLRDQVRLAATTAKDRSLPTALYIDPGEEGRAARIQVRGLRAIGAWHFEEGERWFDQRLRPSLGGRKVPGRYGLGRAPDPEEGAAMMSVATDRDLFDIEAGFAVRVEARLQEREPMTVVRLGQAFALVLVDDLEPMGQIRLQGGSAGAGETVTVRGFDPLPTGVWLTLELVYDGTAVTLYVDGQQIARENASGQPLRRADDDFEVSPAAAPLIGVVDEVQLFAYEHGEWQALPFDVEWIGDPGPIRFGRRGELVAPIPATVGVALNDEVERRTVAPGGILQ